MLFFFFLSDFPGDLIFLEIVKIFIGFIIVGVGCGFWGVVKVGGLGLFVVGWVGSRVH